MDNPIKKHLNNLFQWLLADPFLIKIFGLSFIYTILAASFVQFIVLGMLFPHMGDGQGLLLNTDSSMFHIYALEVAETIKREGWSAWKLRVQGSGTPASFAGAIYSILSPKPWVLIPFNAAIHAFTGIVLVYIYSLFFSRRSSVFLACVPYLFFPFSLSWSSQLHRDGYYFLGFFLIVLFWIRLSILTTKKKFLVDGCKSVLILFAGTTLVWLARPLLIRVVLVVSLIPLLLLSVRFCLLWLKAQVSVKQISFFLTLMALTFFVFADLRFRQSPKPVPAEINKRDKWKETKILPYELDQALFHIAQLRRSYLAYVNSSSIDNEIEFNTARDILVYVPRALLVGVAAPFPKDWFTRGHSAGGGMLRPFFSIETLAVYLGLLSIFIGFRRLAKSLKFWILISMNLATILIAALPVSNLGALYRYRWGNLILLVGLGYGLMAEWWMRKNKTLSKNNG